MSSECKQSFTLVCLRQMTSYLQLRPHEELVQSRISEILQEIVQIGNKF